MYIKTIQIAVEAIHYPGIYRFKSLYYNLHIQYAYVRMYCILIHSRELLHSKDWFCATNSVHTYVYSHIRIPIYNTYLYIQTL